MGDLKLFSNTFSTELILATCSPALGPTFAFGFNASYVRITNLAAVPIFVNLMSTGAATTNDPQIRPGRELILQDQRIYGGGVSTTSTTTSTQDDVSHRVLVAAYGG